MSLGLEQFWRRHFGMWEIVMGICLYKRFLKKDRTFYAMPL